MNNSQSVITDTEIIAIFKGTLDKSADAITDARALRAIFDRGYEYAELHLRQGDEIAGGRFVVFHMADGQPANFIVRHIAAWWAEGSNTRIVVNGHKVLVHENVSAVAKALCAR